LVYKVLNDATQVKAQIQTHNQELQLMRKQMEHNHKNTVLAILASAIMISVAVLFS
jgi:ubiquinone biosynthesis protein